MKKITVIYVLVLLVLFSINAYAEDQKQTDSTLTGSVSVTGMIVDKGGSEAKFNEYRDLKDGVYTGFDLGYKRDGYFLEAQGTDIGFDTQSYGVTGGKYGSYRFNAYYDKFPHNFTDDARSPYDGIGSSRLHLDAIPPDQNVSTWNRLDYSTERKSYGAGMKLDLLSPFFLNIQFNEEQKEGIYPIGVSGSNPGGLAMELPMPVDWTTDNLVVEAGYAKNPYFISFSYLYSRFENDDEHLHFTNIATTADEVFTAPPDNDAYKLDLKGAVKLPYRSSFNFDLAMSEAKSEGDILNTNDFDGKVETESYSFIFKSNPLRFLEGKIFYSYYNRENESDDVGAEDELFEYRKYKYGAELGFKLPQNFFLRTNYTYQDTEREREDIEKTKDNLYTVELRWSGFDLLVTRLIYERLHRVGNSEDDVVRFDAASQDRDTWKAEVDLFPLENLNVSLSVRKIDGDYDDTVFGLVEETGEGFNVYLDYLIAKRLRLYGNFDYERVEQEQIQNSSSSPATRWKGDQINYNYDYGIGSDIFIVPDKWTLNLAFSYIKGNGSIDYKYYDLPTPSNIDLNNWDDYTLKSYKAQLTYNATAHWIITGGYIFEDFDYDDDQYTGYDYTPGSTILTGAYNDSSYRADIGFIIVKYKF